MANHQQPLYGVPGKSHRDPRRHKNDQGLPCRCHLVRPTSGNILNWPLEPHNCFAINPLEINLQPFMQRLSAQLGWSTRFFDLFMGGVQVGVAFQWDNPQRGTPKSMTIHIRQKTRTRNDVALFLLVVMWPMREYQEMYSSIPHHQEEQERTQRMWIVRMNGYGRMKLHWWECTQPQEEECLFPKRLISYHVDWNGSGMIEKLTKYFNQAEEQSMIHGDWLGITSNERTEEMSFGQGLQHSRSFPMPISTIYWTVDMTWRTGHRARTP